MMIITGLSHLFKWENLHNWWLTKYFFAPLYVTLPAASVVSIVRLLLLLVDNFTGTLRLNTVSVCVCVLLRKREKEKRCRGIPGIWSEAADGFQMWSGPQVPHVYPNVEMEELKMKCLDCFKVCMTAF